MTIKYQPFSPLCECGVPGCFEADTLLPGDAWEVAGNAGAGKGHGGSNLLACAPGHIPEGCVVVSDRGTWCVCGLAAPL